MLSSPCRCRSTNRFLSDMGDVSCQGKVTSLSQASLLPMSVDRNATGSPILRGGSVTHVSELDPWSPSLRDSRTGRYLLNQVHLKQLGRGGGGVGVAAHLGRPDGLKLPRGLMSSAAQMLAGGAVVLAAAVARGERLPVIPSPQVFGRARLLDRPRVDHRIYRVSISSQDGAAHAGELLVFEPGRRVGAGRGHPAPRDLHPWNDPR